MAKKPASKTVKKAAPAKKAVAKAETKVAKPATTKKAATKPVAPANKVAVKSTATVAPKPIKKAAPVKKAEVKVAPAKKVVAKVEVKATKSVKAAVKPTPAKKAAVQEVAPVKKVTKTAAKVVAPAEPKPEKKSVKLTPPPVVAVATKKVAPVSPNVEPEKIVHNTNMKKAYSKAELEEFREVILQKRDEIIKQLESLHQIIRDSQTGDYINENSPYSLHMAEQGTDAMEREKTFLYAQRENKFLGYLEEALRRIDAGTYGICVECMDTPQNLCPTCPLIPKERLFAVPHSQHCLPIKQRQEKKKNY